MSEQTKNTAENDLLVTPESCELMRLLFEMPIETDEDYESLGKIFDEES